MKMKVPTLQNGRMKILSIRFIAQDMKVPCFGYDVDYMAGPHDWEHEDPPIGDYVVRKKLYIYDWTGEKLGKTAPQLDYFIQMHNDSSSNYANRKKLFSQR